MRSRRPVLSLAAVALAIAAAIASGAPEERVLRNEDVVRMLVSGKTAAEISDSIRRSRAAFDLSDEMVVELRIAGVPPGVLDAMRERQAEIDLSTEPPAQPAGPRKAEATILVSIEGPEPGTPPRLSLPLRIDDETSRALQMDPAAPDRAITRAAVFLACRTADHVPDAWRSKSALGRDFVGVARHRMLDFRAVEIPEAPASPSRKPAAVDLPAELSAPVEPGIAHDLVVGIAVEVGGRFLRIASASLDGAIPPPEGLRLTAGIRPGDPWPTVALSAAPRSAP